MKYIFTAPQLKCQKHKLEVSIELKDYVFTPGIQTLLVTLAATTLPSAHVQRALPVYISAILFKLSK